MFRRFVSHHRRADALLDSVHELVEQARTTLGLAHESNVKAAEAHQAGIDYHAQGLNDTRLRADEINALKANVG